MNKQIETLAQDICRERTCPTKRNGGDCYKKCKAQIYAERAIEAGWVRQIEGVWEQQPRPYEDEIICSACGANFNLLDNCTEKFNFCPNCGAKMKDGD